MDRLLLSRIDEQLDSSEVAALRFLCLDFVNRKRLEGIGDAKDLFLRLQEQGLLENNVFLSELLRTLRRADLLRRLGTQNRQPLETDSTPVLSDYRKMLYRIYEDLTKENFEKMTFLLNGKLPRRQIEMSNTALDVFAEMEKADLMSNTNVDELYRVLQELDQELALIVKNYKDATEQHIPPLVSMDTQWVNNDTHPRQPSLSISETLPSNIEASVYPDAQPSISSRSPPDEAEYYAMNHQPRGLCVIINNENFIGFELAPRKGTHEDERALKELFRRLGFTVKVYNDLTGEQIRQEIENISRRNFLNDDALVVCVLSHGELGCVFGTDEKKVFLRELTFPFTSDRAATLAGKPKLFFIQACQGGSYQKGSVPLPPMEDTENQTNLEEDAGPIHGETVPSHADFLLGMATVQECKSFRHTSRGSIYIQELCRQLTRSAESDTPDDILSVLTRVNREVGRGDYLKRKQMPEPKYTLTKKVVLKFI
ncbi:caspase-8 [Salarias fasciatus]|uniref:Caspase-8 n=1 Tax=Salarias fasciatus TaxID=181472 RepID=A0A672FE62_SALFA|nr:caspase-8-like [Salarias fasciatus]XP_029970640.1 caspase-8-like [Salarias fasciatus]